MRASNLSGFSFKINLCISEIVKNNNKYIKNGSLKLI